MKYWRVHLQDPISRQVTGTLVVHAETAKRIPIGLGGQHFWVFDNVMTITSICVARVQEETIL